MPTALFSVSDKTGLISLAAALHRRGWRFLASGGTAKDLAAADLPVRPVSSLTGEPEMLDGKVKTLHPAIYAGLLARDSSEDRTALAARGWEPIDLVVVNLYPFEAAAARPESTVLEATQQIDIGGAALLRAAAKNFERVTALCDPADYSEALDPTDPEAFRLRMAHKAFALTAAYDAAIEAYLGRLAGAPAPLRLSAYPALELRYGENPHQSASFYSYRPDGGALGGELLQGKALSYNNLLDMDAAWRAVNLFDEPSVVVVKHTSPCGIASAPRVLEALRRALECDPISAFGSVIACNRPIDEVFAEALSELFVECLVAPDFEAKARRYFKARPRARLLSIPASESARGHELRSVVGGWLRQTSDPGDPADTRVWRTVTRRQPTERELADLRFAWQACWPVKSNAVVLARSESHSRFTVGIGGGQPNRVDCVHLAGRRAAERAVGAVLASDAFFPFADGVEQAEALGATAIVQPGGSRNDRAVIEAADSAGMAMVFTGVRHFRH